MYMAHERRQYILRLLQQRGRIRSAELAQELGVTDETIRIDLVLMQKRGSSSAFMEELSLYSLKHQRAAPPGLISNLPIL